MSQRPKPARGQPLLMMNGEVARQIRQHARTSPSAEICGVLIGQDRPGNVQIEACIAGANAEEAGAHVTFTQDTWEHIYQIKDKEYPNQRIVGWYHSHPGFGVFLSDHDTFIHKNFFASPGQVAWVYDPHSDEEGCFGWVDGEIERLSRIMFCDRRGGERVHESGRPEPTFADLANLRSGKNNEPTKQAQMVSRREASLESEEESSSDSLLQLTTTIFGFLAAVVLGFFACWYFFPHVEVLPVPIDPLTGKPLPGYSVEELLERSRQTADQPPSTPSHGPPPATPNSSGSKENHAQSK